MKILLLAMPDTTDWIDHVMRIPNLSIVSLAGSLPDHEVHTMDLVLCKEHLKKTLSRVLEEVQPDLVGLSSMTFQFNSATRIAAYIREWNPVVKLVVGGYHPTVMAEEEATKNPDLPFDYMVRGEGELIFPRLVSEMDKEAPDFSTINGVSFRTNSTWVHNPPNSELLDVTTLPLPDRSTRKLEKFFVFNKRVDVIETSRGCPLGCNFCSIRNMYGSTFRPFPIERIVTDLKKLKAAGAQTVFFTDDNITYDIPHFKSVCIAIIENGLNDLYYSIQASAMGIGKNPDLVELMDRANIRSVSLGMESLDSTALKFMRKPTNPSINRDAVELLHKHKIGVNALHITGFPDDDEESIRRSFKLLMELKPDTLYSQFITPYPKTEVREELIKQGLVMNKDDFSKYDGFTCNVRTKHLTSEQLWKIQKREHIKTFLPVLLGGNLILKHFLWGFLWCEFKVILTNIRHFLTGKTNKWQLEI